MSDVIPHPVRFNDVMGSLVLALGFIQNQSSEGLHGLSVPFIYLNILIIVQTCWQQVTTIPLIACF